MSKFLAAILVGQALLGANALPKSMTADAVDDHSTIKPAADVAADGPEKIVFMHIQSTGGTAFAEWVELVHRMCARNGSSMDTHHLGHSRNRLNLQDRTDVAYTPVPAGVDTSACGPAKKVCHLGLSNSWAKGATCHNQVELAVKEGCTWVELHHYDISVVNAFRDHGFKAITILRDPIERIRSEQVKHSEKKANGEGKSYGWRVKHSEELRTAYSWRTPELATVELTGCNLYSHMSCARELSRQHDTEGYSRKVMRAAEALPCTSKMGNITGPDGATLLQHAIRELNTFDLIGTITHMDKFAKKFAEKYHITLPNLPDIPTVSHYGQKNPKILKLHQQLAVSPDDDKIRTLLDNDLRLFEHGQKLAVK